MSGQSDGAASTMRELVHAAEPMIWINGRRQAPDAPHVSARDRGLTLGDGVFETMRGHGGTVFRVERHLARLERALARLEIPSPPELRAWLSAAIVAAPWPDISVRLTVTRGVAASGVAVPPDPHPTVIMTVSPFPAFPVATYEHGLTGYIVSGRRNEYAMTAGLKTTAYTDAVAALIEARRAGADEALLLDTEGHCSEATASNLFVWLDRTLVTPPLSCGVLPGITRTTILELAAAGGLAVAERAFGASELAVADEAFLTSSLRGVAPLVWLSAQRIGSGMPGTITRQLMDECAALIKRECGT